MTLRHLAISSLLLAACDWASYESPYAGMPPLKEVVRPAVVAAPVPAAAGAAAPAGATPAAVAPTPAAPPKAPPSPEAAEAELVFSTRCAVCHGPDGRADIPAAKALVPPPRNFHDKVWQKAITDDAIEQVIVKGGAAFGKSPVMAPNVDLATKPDVVRALRVRIRELGT